MHSIVLGRLGKKFTGYKENQMFNVSLWSEKKVA